MKIMHVIIGLGQGGAEKTLYDLAASLSLEGYEQVVVSLTHNDYYGKDISKLGIKIYFLNFEKNLFLSFLKLLVIMKKEKVSVIHSWMYHANLVTIFTKFITRSAKVIWSIHDTGHLLAKRTYLINKFLDFFSWLPIKIIFPSDLSKTSHKYGLLKKSIVIPNPCDFNVFYKFKCDREKFGFPSEDFIFGMLCRYHPIKGIENFLIAASKVLVKYPSIKFSICGHLVADAPNLLKIIAKNKMQKSIFLLQPEKNPETYLNAIDCFVLASSYESFSNSLIEAVACEKMILTTNVGIASDVVYQNGIIMFSNDPIVIAEQMEAILLKIKQGFDFKLKESRAKLLSKYSMNIVKEKYIDSYIHSNK